MLLFIFVAAIVSLVAKWLASTPQALAGIYVFGPLCLIVVAMVPRGLRWQQRIVIITPGAVLLIIVALVVGLSLQIDIDKVLLGIYVCWTPQSFFGAVVLTIGMLIQHRHDLLASDAA